MFCRNVCVCLFLLFFSVVCLGMVFVVVLSLFLFFMHMAFVFHLFFWSHPFLLFVFPPPDFSPLFVLCLVVLLFVSSLYVLFRRVFFVFFMVFVRCFPVVVRRVMFL